MKRMIVSAVVMLFLAGGVSAQSSGSSGASGNTASTSGSGAKKSNKGKKSTKNTKAKSVKVTSDKLNDRKMYKANNGQSATPTGHEATGTGGGFTSIKKDTAVIHPKDTTNAKQKE